MDTIRQDVTFALRMLRKSPIFTFVAVCAIALGSAAVTTIYSVVNTVLLQSTPGIGRPGRLVTVQKSNVFYNGFSNMSYPLYRDLRDGTKTLAGFAAYTEANMDVGLGSSDQRESMTGQIVTGNYFDVLEVKPAAGRFFLPEEDRTPMANPVAVISYRMWADRFNKSPAAIGSKITLQAVPFTIIGVAPEGFNGTIAFIQHDVYVPTMMTAAIRHADKLLDSWNSGWLMAFGRLRNGVPAATAQGELGALAEASRKNAGETDAVRVQVKTLRPIPANGVTVVSIFMAVLMTVAALVLLIAAMNVASMLLARGVARRKEFVVRLAIGANRGRLVRQLLTESVLLFVIGGASGVLLTAWITRALSHINVNVDVPVAVNLTVNGRVLAFTLAVSLLTGILFGLIPALHASRRDLATVLRSDSAGSGSRRERTRSVFVVVQLAMSVLLLVCAGLFVRAFAKGRLVHPGFSMENVVVAPIGLSNDAYDSTRARQFYTQLEQRLLARPDVQAVGASDMVPLSTSSRFTGVDIPGVTPVGKLKHTMVGYETVTRGFFAALELPVRAGRTFSAEDTPAGAPAAVVTEKFAQRYLGGDPARALGKTFTLSKRTYTVVGVVGDGRFVSLTEEPQPFMFLLEDQNVDIDRTLLVKAKNASAAASLSSAIAAEVHALDPTITRPKVQLLSEAAAIGLLPQRISAGVTALLGFVGLLLASLGLYGVIAYGVNQRTREFGIRMALGAEPGHMLRMVVREGLKLVAIGTGIGMVIAIAGSRVLTGFLFGVSPTDPITLLAVPATLGLVALVASWLPARRAARVGLSAALRSE